MKQIVLEKAAVAVVAMTIGVSTAGAATLSTVPMQGGMVMPMVAYHAEHGHLHVMMPTEVPQLTPLMVSHPEDGFDPADPWFDALDPSRQGLSFSRRYGFVMDAGSDPLPAGWQIWLRKLEGSPELAFYRYVGSEPKAWEPIFGTEGSSSEWHWNGMMFHPAVTAPAVAGGLSATFEAYLVDSATGEEVPHSGSGPLALTWMNVSDGRPVLEIGTRLVVAWSVDVTGYELEWTDDLSGGEWTLVTQAPVEVEGKPMVILGAGASPRFYRMRKSP